MNDQFLIFLIKRRTLCLRNLCTNIQQQQQQAFKVLDYKNKCYYQGRMHMCVG